MNTERKSCLECATSGICQEVRNGRCTCCGTVAPATIEPRKFWETHDQFIARAFAEMESHNAALVEAVSVVEEPAPVVRKGRCPHYGAIKAFFACARELGFDTSKASQDRWRGALGMMLGRRVESRSELTGGEWSFATNALKMGRLFI